MTTCLTVAGLSSSVSSMDMNSANNFTITFSSLSYADLVADAAFLYQFTSDYKSAIATSAGVPTTQVGIYSISAGSVVVVSSVEYTDTDIAAGSSPDTFASTLADTSLLAELFSASDVLNSYASSASASALSKMVVTASAPTVASSAEVVAVDDGTTGGTPATDEAMVPENEPFSSSTDATIGPAPSADDEEAVPPEAAVSSSTLDTDTTAASPVNGMVVPEADAATSSSSSSSSSSHTDTTIAPAPSALDEVVVPEVDIVSNSSNSRTDTIIAPAPSALDEVAVSEADAVSSSNRSGSTDAAMALAPSAVEMAVQEAETPSTTPNTSIAPAPSAVEGMAAPEADAVIDYAIGTPDSFSETALIERDGPVGNPCLTSSPCDVLVACTPSSTTGGYTCGVCPAGYAGDGSTCTDIDECSAADNGGCAVQAECTNIPGGRTCGGCPEGMLGSGDSRCLPSSDSCTDDNGGCDLLTVCTDTLDDGNSNGSALNCGECPAGYVGSGATGCIDEDACATSGGEACYGACVDVQAPGTGFKCASCPAGMVGDGTSCIANLCFDGNGGCDATVTCTMDFSTGTAACGECPCGYAPEEDPSLSSGWRCAEVDGCFEVGEEGIGCRDVDECAEENGQCWVLASSPEGLRSTCINKL
ncbi:hypothetical protein CYMTET_18677, partial [Cymbomonas tetramitiformis]